MNRGYCGAMAKTKIKKVAQQRTEPVPVLIPVGLHIKELRGPRKQEWLAETAGISRSIVSNIENGRNAETESLVKVLLALSNDTNSALDMTSVTVGQRGIQDKLSELLNAGEPWLTTARINVESVHSLYLAQKKSKLPTKKTSAA